MAFRHFPYTFCAALFLSTLASPADSVRADLVTPATISERLAAGVVSARERQVTIGKLFHEAGCESVEKAIDKHFANVICTLPGDTTSTIVIGAHSDFIDRGTGIVDDWSGTALLPSLYQSLKRYPHKHRYQFIAFSGEENGLVGSSKFVKNLTKEQLSEIQAFVNLECLGLTPTKVWVHRSAPDLVQLLAQTASSLQLPLGAVNVEQVGDDDTHPFLDKKIAVISIHSVTQETFGILHSSRDNLSVIRKDDYYNSYRLIAFYLALLDMKLAS
jgi:aminopeptidase-like protein